MTNSKDEPPFRIFTERKVYEDCSVFIYCDTRKLKKYGWPMGRTWVKGATKAELKTLGLEVYQTCNCNGTWFYQVDEAKAEEILRLWKNELGECCTCGKALTLADVLAAEFLKECEVCNAKRAKQWMQALNGENGAKLAAAVAGDGEDRAVTGARY